MLMVRVGDDGDGDGGIVLGCGCSDVVGDGSASSDDDSGGGSDGGGGGDGGHKDSRRMSYMCILSYICFLAKKDHLPRRSIRHASQWCTRRITCNRGS